MSSQYKLHEGLQEVVPFNARYAYPTQANPAWKQNIRIPSSSVGPFRPGGANPSITLPAQGYLNTRNTFLSVDVAIVGNLKAIHNFHFQNNIQSIFKRMLLRYGSLPIHDLREVGPLLRVITDNATGGHAMVPDRSSISEGVGGSVVQPFVNDKPKKTDLAKANTTETSTYPDGSAAVTTYDANGVPTTTYTGTDGGAVTAQSDTSGQAFAVEENKLTPLGMGNVRPAFIQVYDRNSTVNHGGGSGVEGTAGDVANQEPVRRYLFQLPFGLFQQNKLIPLKWMASQLTMEFTLADPAECMVCDGIPNKDGKDPSSGDGYSITKFELDAEILEFDGSYDAAFLEGLRKDGVPLKFSDWDTFVLQPTNGPTQTLSIPERNRSLKAAICVLVPFTGFRTDDGRKWDSHATLQSCAGLKTVTLTADGPDKGKTYPVGQPGIGHIVSYQWRVGSKYYPAQPVSCGGSTCNGGAEAYRQLEKALQLVGDRRLSTGQNAARFCRLSGNQAVSSPFDWTTDQDGPGGERFDLLGPSAFAIGLDMETNAGGDVAGLNGEEQNDLSLNITYSASQDGGQYGCRYLVYVYYDALLVLRENNMVELIK
jgi:hypothetical protein